MDAIGLNAGRRRRANPDRIALAARVVDMADTTEYTRSSGRSSRASSVRSS